jgi:hypothetical protein
MKGKILGLSNPQGFSFSTSSFRNVILQELSNMAVLLSMVGFVLNCAG